MPTFTVSTELVRVCQKLNLGGIEGFAAVYAASDFAAVSGFDAIGGLTRFYNDAGRWVVEDCWPLAGRFSYAWISTGSNSNTRASVSYADFTPAAASDDVPTGSILNWVFRSWITQPRIVNTSIVNVRTSLERFDEGLLALDDPEYEYTYGSAPDAGPPISAGVPVKYWFPRGGKRIGLYPLPYDEDTGLLTEVDGLFYPPDLAAPANITANTPTFSYMNADAALLRVLRTALISIQKLSDDYRADSRVPLLMQEIGEVQGRLRAQVPSEYQEIGGPYAHLRQQIPKA